MDILWLSWLPNSTNWSAYLWKWTEINVIKGQKCTRIKQRKTMEWEKWLREREQLGTFCSHNNTSLSLFENNMVEKFYLQKLIFCYCKLLMLRLHCKVKRPLKRQKVWWWMMTDGSRWWSNCCWSWMWRPVKMARAGDVVGFMGWSWGGSLQLIR